MAQVKPFKGIRPDPKYVQRVSSLPYDVYSEKEAREVVARNPMSFLKIVRPETCFPKGVDIYSDKVYERAKKLIEDNVAKGIFTVDTEDCYYIYREIMNGRSQTGLVACFAVDDYVNKVIKEHELTRKDKEEDRTRHIDKCSAQTGLVFLAFKDEYGASAILEQATNKEPLYEFVSIDNVMQLVWKIDDPIKVEKITRAFERVENYYIADGHHRAASAVTVCKKRRVMKPDYTGNEEFNYFMAVAFPHTELQILPYYRVVADLNGLSDEEFLSRVSENFRIGEKGERNCRMYFRGRWHDLSWSIPPGADAVSSLDVAYLQERLLAPVLGIGDPRTDSRISFMGGIRGDDALVAKVDSGENAVAFAMEPVTVEEIMSIADAGAIMPPKSTWFEPKLRSGLFVHEI